jgi:hypothetical protein
VKPHNIYYSNYYESFKLEEISMKVKKVRQTDAASESEFNTTSDHQDYSKLKHDAIILEYCPKIFSIIRACDNIEDCEFDQ